MAVVKNKPFYYSPLSPGDIEEVELVLASELPASLKSLLHETNGVMELLKIGNEWIENKWLVWPAQEIMIENLSLRRQAGDARSDRSFRELLFFANAGSDGILFGFRTMDGQANESSVCIWTPIDDTLTESGLPLDRFLEGWLTGAIAV
jgi:hypothetical protein